VREEKRTQHDSSISTKRAQRWEVASSRTSSVELRMKQTITREEKRKRGDKEDKEEQTRRRRR
jgi:hypothetical protein